MARCQPFYQFHTLCQNIEEQAERQERYSTNMCSPRESWNVIQDTSVLQGRDWRMWRSLGGSRMSGRDWTSHKMSGSWWAHSRSPDCREMRPAGRSWESRVQHCRLSCWGRRSLNSAGGPPGAGGEVSRAVVIGHIDRRCKDNFYLLDCGIYTLLAIGINNYKVIISTFLLPHLHDVLSIIISVSSAG